MECVFYCEKNLWLRQRLVTANTQYLLLLLKNAKLSIMFALEFSFPFSLKRTEMLTHDAAKHFLCRSTFLIYFSKFTALSVAKSSLSPSLHQWMIALWITHFFLTPVPVKLLQSCPALSDPMDHSAPGSSLHGIHQARVLEWIAISFSRGSPRPRDRTWISRIPGRHSNLWATREALTPKDTRKRIIKKPQS